MIQTHKACEMPYICQLCGYRSSVYNDVVDHFKKVLRFLAIFKLRLERYVCQSMNILCIHWLHTHFQLSRYKCLLGNFSEVILFEGY
jgi:hypothetical protein